MEHIFILIGIMLQGQTDMLPQVKTLNCHIINQKLQHRPIILFCIHLIMVLIHLHPITMHKHIMELKGVFSILQWAMGGGRTNEKALVSLQLVREEVQADTMMREVRPISLCPLINGQTNQIQIFIKHLGIILLTPQVIEVIASQLEVKVP